MTSVAETSISIMTSANALQSFNARICARGGSQSKTQLTDVLASPITNTVSCILTITTRIVSQKASNHRLATRISALAML